MPQSFSRIDILQGNAGGQYGGSPVGTTANGNGATLDAAGLRAQVVEIQETAGGTATVTLQGSFDGSTWYQAGFQQIDATATRTLTVGGISVLANSKHVYQVLDLYPLLSAAVSSVAGGATVLVRSYTVGE